MNLQQLQRSGFTTRQAKALRRVGGGPVSSKKVASASMSNGAQPIGESGFHSVSFAGGVITTGADALSGWPGESLPLTIDGDFLVLPDADVVYDVGVSAMVDAGAANAGKWARIVLEVQDAPAVPVIQWAPVGVAGQALFSLQGFVPTLLSPNPAALRLTVDARLLTEAAASVVNATVLVIER